MMCYAVLLLSKLNNYTHQVRCISCCSGC